MKQITRSCFICRNTFNKKELNRIVKTSDGQFFLDKTGKANGRGAYICNCQDCLNKLKNPKIMNKAFKCEFPVEVYIKLCEELIGKQ